MAETIGNTRDTDIKTRFETEEEERLSFPAHTLHPSREGGDEFALVAFESLHSAIKIAKRLKREVADHVDERVPEVRKNIREGFRVSTGTATLEGDENWASLVARAEAQMYLERDVETHPLKRVRRGAQRFWGFLHDNLDLIHIPNRGH